MAYKIGSFNVKNLSLNSQRDLDRIARLIKKCHVFALQEVLDEGKILKGVTVKGINGQARAYERSLLSRLGPNWDIRWCAPIIKAKDYPYISKDARGEGYAFLWRKDIFEMLNDEYGNAIEPKIYGNYKTVEDGMIRLIRDPAYFRLRLRNRPQVEIRLITTHIVYSKPQKENLSIDLDGIGASTMRKNEFKILAGQIYPRIAEYYKDINCTSPYTVILGDYNMNLFQSGVHKSIVPEVICFDKKGRMLSERETEGAHCCIYTVQDELSTVKKDEPGLASNYDHFSFDGRIKAMVNRVYCVDAIHEQQAKKTEEELYTEYRNRVSDHLPIVLELSL